MVHIDVGDPKVAREMLCVAQSAIMALNEWDARTESHLSRIEKMVDQIDVLRPLGPDGNHGDRHTKFCGCEDVVEWRIIEKYPHYEINKQGDVRDDNRQVVNRLKSFDGEEWVILLTSPSGLTMQGEFLRDLLATAFTWEELKNET